MKTFQSSYCKLFTSFVLLSIFIAVAIGCSGGDENAQSSAERSGTTADRIKVYFTEEGKLQAILYASRIEERDKSTFGWDIDVDFFADNDTIPDGGMVADSGIVKKGRGRRKSEVSVFGNVHLTAPDGTELFSDSLRWNPRAQMIESNSQVKIVRGDEVINGVGFVSDASFKKIRIKKVSGKIEQ